MKILFTNTTKYKTFADEKLLNYDITYISIHILSQKWAH